MRQFLATQQQTWKKADAPTLKQFEANLQWSSRRDGLYAANTVYQGLRMIRGFYRWARARDLVATDPTHSWILPRPRSNPDRLLTQTEVLQLFNLPDLAEPIGQRDALMLALVYHGGHSLDACRRLRLGDLDWNDENCLTLKPDYERYARQGRAGCASEDQPILLLTKSGKPLSDSQALRARLRLLGQQIGRTDLCVRILRKSRKAHQADLSKRQEPLI